MYSSSMSRYHGRNFEIFKSPFIFLYKISKVMKLNHRKAFVDSGRDSNGFKSRVTALCYSEDSKRLALATVNRVVTLFDDSGTVADRFNTKANDGGPKDYVIK